MSIESIVSDRGDEIERPLLAGQRPIAARPRWSYISLLRHLEGVVNLDAEVTHRALELAVAEEQLHRPQILGAAVDQRRLCSAHRMRPVSRIIQSDRASPTMDYPGILPRRDMRRTVDPAGKKIVA